MASLGGLGGAKWGRKRGHKWSFFVNPLWGTILVSFWVVFWSILGGFWYPLGRRRRGILVMFSFAFCSLAAGLSQHFGKEIRVLCCFGSLVFFCLAGVPWCFLWSLVSLSQCTSAAREASEASEVRGAIEWCSLAFPMFVCVLVSPLPV